MNTVDKIFIGVAVGAILGVMYAPDRGSVTMRKLARTGNDIKDRFNDLKDTIADKIDNLKDSGEDSAYEEMMVLENEGAVNRPEAW